MSALYEFSRIGFHYYPDTLHFRQADLNRWLPTLLELKASWLTLIAPAHQAIPEFFLTGLVAAGIKPLLHLPFSPSQMPELSEFEILLSNYARWGVKQIAFFDRPNTRLVWQNEGWMRSNLIERFLDLFIPFAEAALKYGIRPIFPPLEPGGDYWDLAFLQSALEGLRRRGKHELLSSLILGAYAWADPHSLEWGAGGPERWAASRPYSTPENSQDQIGFRIFDWYLAASQAALGESLPVILLRAGCRSCSAPQTSAAAQEHAEAQLALYQLAAAANTQAVPDGLSAIPQPVKACCFWLLSSAARAPESSQAWFKADGSHLPVVEHIQKWQGKLSAKGGRPAKKTPLIDHYLLLPTYPWGVSDWHLQVTQPFIKKHRPTVGFSLVEANQARRVTVIGDSHEQISDACEQLQSAGCFVDVIIGSGTDLAQILAKK